MESRESWHENQINSPPPPRSSRVQLFRCNFYFSPSLRISFYFFRSKSHNDAEFNEMEIIIKRHVLQSRGFASPRNGILSILIQSRSSSNLRDNLVMLMYTIAASEITRKSLFIITNLINLSIYLVALGDLDPSSFTFKCVK